MSLIKNSIENEIYNDEIPIWTRAQRALQAEGAFTRGNDEISYSKAYNAIYGRRSNITIFNNLRTDKDLYLDYINSTNNLLSESCKEDMVNTQTDIIFLREKTPELDDICLRFSRSILSHRDSMRDLGIDIPVKNDTYKTIKAEMALRQSYMNKLWHNSLYAMTELGMEVPDWTKILPYRPLVSAIDGVNLDDKEIGESLLSLLKEKYPKLYSELLDSNPYSAPLIGFTVGLSHLKHSIWPSLEDIRNQLETGIPVDYSWEKKFIQRWDYTNSEYEEAESTNNQLCSKYNNISMNVLRRIADNMEITGAWTKCKEELIIDLDLSTDETVIRMLPKIQRLTDWSIFISERVLSNYR